jgi:CHAT domain-containing protein
VHFACHGAVDPDEPGQSQLFLEDHQQAPLTVADIGALRLPGGLAFLSACETAVTNGNLSNEAVHLTGAFQLAGYRDVVGTLWQVGDLASARLVGHFYRALTASGSGYRQPAIALNAATRRLRDSYPSWPAFWAGHVHVGP